ncbi:transglutaminase family protein [Shewanella sp.]|uniref:transglutaminase family protein n=1 Tax=Shewanella sp. TaxID=50422 RepID=UPI001EB7E36A|nr:transglutaminase family protein [Shewanella sp.]NRB24424.1 hypothetical protein [Shewanella sp.]
MKGFILFLLFTCPVQITFATESTGNDVIKIIESILAKPDANIDLAKTKLTIDKLVDPSININAAMGKINQMVKTLKRDLNPDMMPLDKALSLSSFLYESGYWNNYKPFQYDLDDPFGQKLNNKLISTYLNTKKGNCISMPILYAILAEKLGLDVTLSTAPLHVFVKFKDPTSGKYFNIETTDKGQPASNDFYHTKSLITDIAIQNGVYLQPLTKKQTVAVMAMVLNGSFEKQGKWQHSIDLAKLLLKVYPRYAYAMIKVGNGYSRLLNIEISKAKIKGSYTSEEKQHMDHLYQQNIQWFAKAEKLGWHLSTQEENDNYLNAIKKRQALLTKTTQGK